MPKPATPQTPSPADYGASTNAAASHTQAGPDPSEYGATASGPMVNSALTSPATFTGSEPSAFDPNLLATPEAREDLAKEAARTAGEYGRTGLEVGGSVIGSLLVPQVTGPVMAGKFALALERHAPAVMQLFKNIGGMPMVNRSIASGLGMATGRQVGNITFKDVLQDAPRTSSEAWAQQWEAFKKGFATQAGGEVALNFAATTAAKTVAGMPGLPEFEAIQRVEQIRLKEKLIKQRNLEQARLEAKFNLANDIKSINEGAENIVQNIGREINPETSAIETKNMFVAIKRNLDKSMRQKFKEIDSDAAISLDPDGPGKVDTTELINDWAQLVKGKPRGKGAWQPWTEMPGDLKRVYGALSRGVKAEQSAQESVEEAAASIASTPTMKVEEDQIGALVKSLDKLKEAQAIHGKVPVAVLTEARGNMARTLANPNTSDELKEFIMVALEKPNKRAIEAWDTFSPKGDNLCKMDNLIVSGLNEINPLLTGNWLDAMRYWHRSSLLEDMVLYRLMGKNPNNIRPLADYISPGRPQSVTRARELLKSVGAEEKWPEVQRTVLQDLVYSKNKEVDIAKLGQKLDNFGPETMSQLTRAADGTRDAVMVARVDALRDFSNRYRQLMQKGDPLLTSSRLENLDNAINKIEIAEKASGFGAKFIQYATSPHVTAGIMTGRVFGWFPSMVGGSTSGALRSSGNRIIEIAANPARLRAFTANLEAYVATGKASYMANMVKSWALAKSLSDAQDSQIKLLRSHQTQPETQQE